MKLNIRGRVVLPVLALLVLSLALTIFISYLTVSAVLKDFSYRHGDALSGQYADQIQNELDTGIGVARTISQAFIGMKSAGITDRNIYNAILKEALELNPELLGVWSGWEPNALDGKDEQFRNAPSHDSTGRFIPQWSRGAKGAEVSALVDYETPGAGDYYVVPKRTGEEAAIEPFYYSYTGKRG